MGAIYNAFGIIGLKLLKFTCSAAAMVFLTLALTETEAPITLQLAILLAVSVAIAPQMQFRPQLFTVVLMSALLAILARYTFRGRASVWLAVAMLAVWANLHGGFIVGLATLGTFSAIVLLQDLVEGRGAKRGLFLFAMFAASVLVTLVTPYGFGTWSAVAHAMVNPQTREVISDWQPLLRAVVAIWHRNHAGAVPLMLAIVMFSALAASFALNPRRNDLPMVAIAATMIFAAFIAMRNLPLAVMATAIPLARHSSRAVRQRPLRKPTCINQIIVSIAAVAMLIETGLLSPMLRAGSPKPNGAIAFMEAHRLSGNIMTDFAWGEYLIWHLEPASKVYLDGRYDTVYPAEVIDDYLAFEFGRSGAKTFLRKYPHDFMLLGSGDEMPLALMTRARGWTQLYRDGSCILFARADSAAAKIPSVVVSSKETPASCFP